MSGTCKLLFAALLALCFGFALCSGRTFVAAVLGVHVTPIK